MDWQAVSYPINLTVPPQINMVGNGWHGFVPVERFFMPGIWCLNLYTHDSIVTVDGVRLPIHAGFVGITPPDSQIEYHYLTSGASLYAQFSLPPTGESTRVPAMQDAGADFERLHKGLEEAIFYLRSSPSRAQARLWDLLWSVTSLSNRDTVETTVAFGQYITLKPTRDVVRLAEERIELRLGEPLTVSALADELQISHNHLTRQFRARTGSTVIGYIQQRRVDRARILLSNTSRTVKSIAAEVGIPDVQQFNKTVRRLLGRSPSEIRAAL